MIKMLIISDVGINPAEPAIKIAAMLNVPVYHKCNTHNSLDRGEGVYTVMTSVSPTFTNAAQYLGFSTVIDTSKDSDILYALSRWTRESVYTPEVGPMPSLLVASTREVRVPEYGTAGSAGIDFFVPEDFGPKLLEPLGRVLIPSGIHCNIPAGHMLMAADKSGVSSKLGLMVHAPIIDSDYQGEIHLAMTNVSSSDVLISPGMKLLQMVLVPIAHASISTKPLGELFTEETSRGSKGFGEGTGK